jgi:hypothetical protein
MNAVYFRAIGARMMRPAEHGRHNAESAVAGIVDAQDAWETLATRDLIPARWIDDPTLCFRGANASNGASERHPQTVRDCVTLASDVAGVDRALLLLQEAWAHLEFVGVRPPTRTFWSCSGRRGVWNADVSQLSPAPFTGGLCALTAHVRRRLGLSSLFSDDWERDLQHEAALGLIEASEVRGLDFEETLDTMMAGGHWLSAPDTWSWMDWYVLADASLTWSRAVEGGLSIPAADAESFDPFVPPEARTIRNAGVLAHYGRAFAEVPDPVTPLWQILELGYLVDLHRPVPLDTLIAPAR